MVEDERRFTREEANAELPELRERLPRLRESRRTVIRTSERITEAVAADGGGVAGSDWFEAQRSLKAELLYLAERGILLRDPETGLVDLPRRGGRASRVPVLAARRGCGRLVPRAARGVHQPEASVTMADGVAHTRPTVVVMGATADEPPPNIDVIADDVELRYAPDRASLERAIVDAEIVYTWWGERADLEAAWPLARKLEWVAASNVGINALLFPALVESDVVLTNARGAADQPITETVVGFVVALAKGFRPMFDRQRTHVWETHETDRLAGSTVLVVGPGPIGAVDRTGAPRRTRDARGGGRTLGARGRRRVRDDPRHRRAARGAGGGRLRDRRDAADPADRPRVRCGGVRRDAADRAVHQRRPREDGGRDGARRRAGVGADRRRGPGRVRGGAAPRREPALGHGERDRLSAYVGRRDGLGRGLRATCSTTTCAVGCRVRHCATSSTSGSGSRPTTRPCRNDGPLIRVAA